MINPALGKTLFKCPCCWALKERNGMAECHGCHDAQCKFRAGVWYRSKECPGTKKLRKRRGLK